MKKPRFRFNERVRITNGFYDGGEGTVVSCSPYRKRFLGIPYGRLFVYTVLIDPTDERLQGIQFDSYGTEDAMFFGIQALEDELAKVGPDPDLEGNTGSGATVLSLKGKK